MGKLWMVTQDPRDGARDLTRSIWTPEGLSEGHALDDVDGDVAAARDTYV